MMKCFFVNLFVLLVFTCPISAKQLGEVENLLLGAVQNGQTDLVESIILSGIDVNIKLNEGKTPLHFAAEYSKFESVVLLLKHGAGINKVDLYGRTPLHFGIIYKEIAIFLLENGADSLLADYEGWKPLHRAYKGCDIDLMKELIKRGGSPNDFAPDGRNALHYASQSISIPADYFPEILPYIKFLLEEQKMDVNKNSNWGWDNEPGFWTPIMFALLQQKYLDDDFEILEYLIEKGANLNSKCYYNGRVNVDSILFWAKGQGVPHYIIMWMIQNGAK